MYVPDHLKLRIALARQLKAFYYEDGNPAATANGFTGIRQIPRTTYVHLFSNYLKEGKYDLSGIKLAPHIVATTALLEPDQGRPANGSTPDARTPYRRFPRSPPRYFAVLHKEAEEGKPVRKLRIY